MVHLSLGLIIKRPLRMLWFMAIIKHLGKLWNMNIRQYCDRLNLICCTLLLLFSFFFSTKCAPFKYFRFSLALWKNKSEWCYAAFSFFKLITLDYNWHKFLNIRERNSVYFIDKWVKNNGRNYLSCWKRVKISLVTRKKSRCSFGLILFVLMTTKPLAIANKYTLF